jgi:8-oxo-dGTP pyrophosphatase MutT (NUDIX family)
MPHIHEKIDFTASVYVVYANKVLLHLHTKTNLWLPPGGHVELDEDPNQTAVREVKEEAGLDITLIGNPPSTAGNTVNSRELIPPKFLNRHYFISGNGHEHIDSVYFGVATTDVLNPENSDEDWRWLNREEIESEVVPLKPDVRVYALGALDELSK